MRLPLEAVPNFSAALDAEVVQALRDALAGSASVLDVHSDNDHNRTVFTVAGAGTSLVDALFAAARVAVERIDLGHHDGVHPRIGAADVMPIIPLTEQARDEAHVVARELAARLANELELPVFLYGDLCPENRLPDGARPAYYRRGGLVELAERLGSRALEPDLGPDKLHPSAGATMVGVRMPLIAFNVELDTQDVAIARDIARDVRETGGGFLGVRALGLQLESGGNVQVSMNIEDWRVSMPHQIVSTIVGLAARRGVDVIDSELVGLMPLEAALAAAGDTLKLPALTTDSLLELRLLEETVTAADGEPRKGRS